MIAILPPHEIPGTKFNRLERSMVIIKGIKLLWQRFFRAAINFKDLGAEKLALRKTKLGWYVFSFDKASSTLETRMIEWGDNNKVYGACKWLLGSTIKIFKADLLIMMII